MVKNTPKNSPTTYAISQFFRGLYTWPVAKKRGRCNVHANKIDVFAYFSKIICNFLLVCFQVYMSKISVKSEKFVLSYSYSFFGGPLFIGTQCSIELKELFDPSLLTYRSATWLRWTEIRSHTRRWFLPTRGYLRLVLLRPSRHRRRKLTTSRGRRGRRRRTARRSRRTWRTDGR